MANIYLKSGAGAVVLSARAWALGDKMVPTRTDVSTNVATARKWVWECTTAGTSVGTPTWPATVTQDVTTVTDSGVVWTARKPGYSSGTTEDWAYATIFTDYATSATSVAGGDRVVASSTHTENNTTAITPLVGGSSGIVVSVDDSVAPPTTYVKGAKIQTTGAVAFTVGGSGKWQGFVFEIGIGATGSTGNFNYGSTGGLRSYVEDCDIILATNPGATTTITNSNLVEGIFRNVNVKLGVVGNRIIPNGPFTWIGGGAIAGTATPTVGLIQGNGYCPKVFGVDFTNFASTLGIFNAGSQSAKGAIYNCKLPASWTGSLATGTLGRSERYSMYNCDSGAVNYKLKIQDYAGTINDETTRVMTGGASDGTTAYSWKMASNANTDGNINWLATDPIIKWVDATGSAVTATVEILHDSVTDLTNADIWIEVEVLDNSTAPEESIVSDRTAWAAVTGTAHAASSATWTTTGMSNPRKQKIEVAVTPQMKGFVMVKVYLAKASYTVYVNPQVALV